jgi:hypothetical protein
MSSAIPPKWHERNEEAAAVRAGVINFAQTPVA